MHTVRQVGKELQGWLESGRLKLTTADQINLDLASPQPMWCLHEDARKVLSTATLAIAKVVVDTCCSSRPRVHRQCD